MDEANTDASDQVDDEQVRMWLRDGMPPFWTGADDAPSFPPSRHPLGLDDPETHRAKWNDRLGVVLQSIAQEYIELLKRDGYESMVALKHELQTRLNTAEAIQSERAEQYLQWALAEESANSLTHSLGADTVLGDVDGEPVSMASRCRVEKGCQWYIMDDEGTVVRLHEDALQELTGTSDVQQREAWKFEEEQTLGQILEHFQDGVAQVEEELKRVSKVVDLMSTRSFILNGTLYKYEAFGGFPDSKTDEPLNGLLTVLTEKEMKAAQKRHDALEEHQRQQREHPDRNLGAIDRDVAEEFDYSARYIRKLRRKRQVRNR